MGRGDAPVSDAGGGVAPFAMAAPLAAGPAPLPTAPAVAVSLAGSALRGVVAVWSAGCCHTEWARVMMEARSNLKPSTCISNTQ